MCSRRSSCRPPRSAASCSATGPTAKQSALHNPHLNGQAPKPPVPGKPGDPTDEPAAGLPDANFLYYYHPDHLGSSSYVTEGLGKRYEHMQYFRKLPRQVHNS